jgi:hypothetical protein
MARLLISMMEGGHPFEPADFMWAATLGNLDEYEKQSAFLSQLAQLRERQTVLLTREGTVDRKPFVVFLGLTAAAPLDLTVDASSHPVDLSPEAVHWSLYQDRRMTASVNFAFGVSTQSLRSGDTITPTSWPSPRPIPDPMSVPVLRSGMEPSTSRSAFAHDDYAAFTRGDEIIDMAAETEGGRRMLALYMAQLVRRQPEQAATIGA